MKETELQTRYRQLTAEWNDELMSDQPNWRRLGEIHEALKKLDRVLYAGCEELEGDW